MQLKCGLKCGYLHFNSGLGLAGLALLGLGWARFGWAGLGSPLLGWVGLALAGLRWAPGSSFCVSPTSWCSTQHSTLAVRLSDTQFGACPTSRMVGRTQSHGLSKSKYTIAPPPLATAPARMQSTTTNPRQSDSDCYECKLSTVAFPSVLALLRCVASPRFPHLLVLPTQFPPCCALWGCTF